MDYLGILFALVYAIILTAIFSLFFRNTGPWSGFWIFFILIFLIALGVGEWTEQVGPAAWGYYWLPGLIAAIILALVLAAVTPGSRPLKEDVSSTPGQEAALATGLFFWILVLLLIGLALGGIFREPGHLLAN